MPTTSSSFLWALILTLCLAQTVHAQTIRYVSATGTNVNPATATSWATATADLQGAINSLSATGGQVWVKSGTYKPGGPANTDRNLSFALKNNVALYGNFAGSEQTLTDRPDPNPVTIRPSSSTLSGDIGTVGNAGDNSFHVFSNPSGLDASAVLDGFVITGGAGSTQGGGMYNPGGNPSLRNCAFLNNAVSVVSPGTSTTITGGAIYNQSSSPTLTNCLFQNNTVSGAGGTTFRNLGGAIYNDQSSSPTLTNCLFQNNTVLGHGWTIQGNFGDYGNFGGAIYNDGGNPTLTNCAFLFNNVFLLEPYFNRSYGGAVYNNGGNPRLLNCTFQNNTAPGWGGAVVNSIGNAQLTNCFFQNNSSSLGGATANVSGSPQLTDCSFYSNSVKVGDTSRVESYYSYGGAIYNLTNATLTRCSFQNNTSVNYGGAIYNTSNPILQNCSFINNSVSTGDRSYNVGGAIYNAGGSPQLTNCAFSGNAADLGGAIANVADGGSTASPTVTNCSFQANASYELGAVIYSTGGGNRIRLTNCVLFDNMWNNTFFSNTDPSSISVAYSLFENTVTDYVDGGNNLITGPSPFVSPANLQLTATAPAVNKGDLASYTAVSGPATDLVGNPRVAGGRIDMGAYEFQGPFPTRLYVKANATGANTGLTWADAFPDLQSALNYPLASALTEIWVASGLYKPTTTTDRTLSFALKNGVALYGGFAGTETALGERPATFPPSTTLSGDIGLPVNLTDNSYHVFNHPSSLNLGPTARLDGFLITAGNANAGDDTFGGGMYNNGANSPTITNCLFQANTASFGGAIFNRNGSNTLLINCGFLANTASARGGAIANFNSNPGVVNGSFLSNSAGNGGAMNNFLSSPGLTNCLFWNNDGTNTFSNQTSDVIAARYCLFEPTVTGYSSLTGNLTTTTLPLVSATSFQLIPGSPAINAGDNASYSAVGGPVTDLAGKPRIALARVDIGASEFQVQGISNEILTLKDGLWSDPTVWNVGRVPLTGERVRLKHIIIIPASYLAVSGTLSYDANSRLVYAVGAQLQFSQP